MPSRVQYCQFSCCVSLVGYAPFGSMTTRETFVDVSDQTITAPGPGQYDPLLKNLDRVKGGQSLTNTVKALCYS